MSDEQKEREYKRQRIIEKAVSAADKIILDGSDGSEEETDYLTAMVAMKFIERTLQPLASKMLQKDISKGL